MKFILIAFLFTACGSAAHQKDLIENLAHREICTGKKTPAQIQAEFSTDWRQIK